MNLNKVILAGRVVADPETRMTSGGATVSNFSMATNSYYQDKSGQRQEQTEFHRVVTWARTAEVVRDYLKKGQLVLIEGRLQTSSWETKDGSKRYKTEIVAERLQLGPKAGTDGSSDQSGDSVKSDNAAPKSTPVKEEDIPVIDEDTVMDFDEDKPKQVDPKDIPF